MYSHVARDGPGPRVGPACGPPSDTPSPCSTSPSPNLTASRRLGRSPSTSPTSAVTAPRAASTASSSTSPGEPCPHCPGSHLARPAMRVFIPTSSPSSPPQVSCPGSYSASRFRVWVLACPLLPGNRGSLASFRSRCALQKPCWPSQHQTPFPRRECQRRGRCWPRGHLSGRPRSSPHLLASCLAAVGMSTWTAWAASRTKSQCAPRMTPTRRHGRAWRRPRRRRGAEGPLSSSPEAVTWVRIGGWGSTCGGLVPAGQLPGELKSLRSRQEQEQE